MINPHPVMITDEASGIQVRNQRHDDFEAGAKAERERLMALVEKEYPAVTGWPFWKKLTETGEL